MMTSFFARLAAFIEARRSNFRALYDGLDERWNRRAQTLNLKLREAGVPVQVANLSSIWTVVYTQPSRYHWMLQYYLRAHGLALSWVGTGRLIFSLNYADADFDAVVELDAEKPAAVTGPNEWATLIGVAQGAAGGGYSLDFRKNGHASPKGTAPEGI